MSKKFTDKMENRVILLCSRKDLDATQEKLLRDSLKQSLDWEYILQFSNRHGLTLLLHHHFTRDRTAIPDVSWKILQRNARASIMRNLKLGDELKGVIQLLRESGITALAYKGPTQAIAAYGSLQLRTFQDLDILVRPCDLTKARETLLREAYYCNPESLLPEIKNSRTLAYCHNLSRESYSNEESFVPVLGQGCVDLHWNFSPSHFPFPIKIEESWDRKVLSPLGAGIYTLCLEDMFLSMAFHGGKHMWGRIEWICSVHEFLLAHKNTLDWDHIKSVADKSGNYRVVALALRLANDIHTFAGSVDRLALPTWAKQWSEEKTIDNASAIVWRNFSLRVSHPADYMIWLWLPYYLRLFDYKANNSRILRDYFRRLVAPNAVDLSVLALPKALYPLYFPLRMIRLCIKFLHRKLSYFISKSRKNQ